MIKPGSPTAGTGGSVVALEAALAGISDEVTQEAIARRLADELLRASQPKIDDTPASR